MNTSATYRLIPTSDILAVVTSTLNKLGVEHQYSVLPSGRSDKKGWIQVTMPSLRTTIHGDSIVPRILLKNSTDGSTALQFHVGFLRLVCSNGMMAGHSIWKARVIHRVGEKVENFLDNLPQKLEEAVQFIASGAFVQRMEQATATPVKLVEQMQIVDLLHTGNVISLRGAQDTIRALASSRRRSQDSDTVWGLLNVVNEEMARRGRSPSAQLDRNADLLGKITTALEEVRKVA